MKVDRDQFMDQGYLILRDFIPLDRLEALRASCETILERQKVNWARERGPDDPPGGEYEKARQPRVFMEVPGIIDEETANVVEDFWVADETLDTASQILCNPEPNVTRMMMMCSPVRDWPGGTGWHRDIHPVDMAPLDALTADILENGPRYTQWNVPLYDDDVLWVVPGSHRRRNSEEENDELLKDHKKPVSSGVPVELKAGDGVIYSNFLIHTGSNYTTKMRRTLHGGHAIYSSYPEFAFADTLAPWARERFESFAARGERMQDKTESTLRAVLNRDEAGYRAGLESLQPGAGPHGRTVLTIYLSKTALHMRTRKDSDFAVTAPVRFRASSPEPITLNWGPDFADRFTKEESVTLWDRFEGLDTMLQDDMEMFEPAFQSGPMHYYFNELPDGADAETFIASWASG